VQEALRAKPLGPRNHPASMVGSHRSNQKNGVLMTA